MSKRNTGFTLIEMVASMLIISIAVTGTLLAFQSATLHSADPMLLHQSMAIGQSYLSEILAKDFPITVPCPAPPGGGRSVYTNVCDYNGLSDTGVRDQNNQAISGLGNYNVLVNVATSGVSLNGLASGSDVVRIDVTVSHKIMTDVKLSVYRTKYP